MLAYRIKPIPAIHVTPLSLISMVVAIVALLLRFSSPAEEDGRGLQLLAGLYGLGDCFMHWHGQRCAKERTSMT